MCKKCVPLRIVLTKMVIRSTNNKIVAPSSVVGRFEDQDYINGGHAV